MNELTVFNNPEFGEIRTIEKDGEPWFVGKDVAVALGYERPTDATRKHVDEEDRGVANLETPSGNQDMVIINESGMYSLIMSSRLPNSKKFKHWVTSEVLPSIRKTGSYSMMPKDYASALRALADEVEKRERLEIENKIQGQIITEYQPKVDYYTEILNSSGTMTVSQIAKDYGMSAKQLNAILRDEHVQYNSRGQWLLYQDKASQGYTKSKTIPITYNDGEKGFKIYTEWNQKGRLFIHEILTKRGIKAIMDR